MSEGIGVTQPPELNPETVQQNSKRKPDSLPPLDGFDDPRRISKTPRLDRDQNPNPNPNPNPDHDSSAENGEKVKTVDEGEPEKLVQDEKKETDQNRGCSKDVLVDRGKGKMIVEEEEEIDHYSIPKSKPYIDKGKGKMIVEEEEEEDSSDDSDDEACVASGSDSEYSDDPLMEVDLNNILPSRTRRWAPPVPGAYLVPLDQDDEDDDDADADVDDDDDDDGEEGNDSDSE